MGSLVDYVAGIIDSARGDSQGGLTLTGEPMEPVVINPDVRMQVEGVIRFKRREGGLRDQSR